MNLDNLFQLSEKYSPEFKKQLEKSREDQKDTRQGIETGQAVLLFNNTNGLADAIVVELDDEGIKYEGLKDEEIAKELKTKLDDFKVSKKLERELSKVKPGTEWRATGNSRNIKLPTTRSLQAADKAEPRHFAGVQSRAEQLALSRANVVYFYYQDPNSDDVVYEKVDDFEPTKIEDFKEDFSDKHNIPEENINDIIVTTDFNKIKGITDLKLNRRGEFKDETIPDTTQAAIANWRSISALRQMGAITLSNINDVFKKTFKQKKQNVIFKSLLKKFIDNPGKRSGMYPFTILDDITDITEKYDFKDVTTIPTRFGEVLGPVGIITDNVSGNANDVILDFLGANSHKELMNSATIHFNSAGNDKLFDGFVEYNGNVLSISSKANGSLGTSISSINLAVAEIKRLSSKNSKLKSKLSEITEGRYSNYYKLLLSLIQEIPKYHKNLLVYQASNPNYKDATLLKDLEEFSIASKNVNEDSELLEKFNFSNELKSLYKKYMNDIVSAKKDISKKSVIDILNYALVKEGLGYLNNDGDFSNLIIWIFNHSATLQVDTFTESNFGKKDPIRKGAKGERNPLVMVNIRATWPSTAVHRAELLEDSDRVSFRLKLNGSGVTKTEKDTELSDIEVGVSKESILKNKEQFKNPDQYSNVTSRSDIYALDNPQTVAGGLELVGDKKTIQQPNIPLGGGTVEAKHAAMGGVLGSELLKQGQDQDFVAKVLIYRGQMLRQAAIELNIPEIKEAETISNVEKIGVEKFKKLYQENPIEFFKLVHDIQHFFSNNFQSYSTDIKKALRDLEFNVRKLKGKEDMSESRKNKTTRRLSMMFERRVEFLFEKEIKNKKFSDITAINNPELRKQLANLRNSPLAGSLGKETLSPEDQLLVLSATQVQKATEINKEQQKELEKAKQVNKLQSKQISQQQKINDYQANILKQQGENLEKEVTVDQQTFARLSSLEDKLEKLYKRFK